MDFEPVTSGQNQQQEQILTAQDYVLCPRCAARPREREREERPANGKLSSDRVDGSLRFLSFTPEEHPAPSSRSIEAPRPNTWGVNTGELSSEGADGLHARHPLDALQRPVGECWAMCGGLASSCSFDLSAVGNLLYSLDVLL